MTDFSEFDHSECDVDIFGWQRFPLYIVIPETVMYMMILITGIIGNIITCIVITMNKSMHTTTNYYLFSLAISDLVLLVSSLPLETYMLWFRYPYILGSTFCFLRPIIAESSSNASVLTITAFMLERYFAICHPFLAHKMSNLSRTCIIIIVIWILAVALAIPIAATNRLSFILGCPICAAVEPMMDFTFEISSLLFFVVPLIVITVLYVLIVLKLRASSVMNESIGTNGEIQSKSTRKTVKMLIAVVVAFFICWAPFHVQRLYSIYQVAPPSPEMHDLYLKIYELVTYISGILYYMSATINPILYNIMSVKFREAFKETFSRCCGIGHLHHGRPQRSYSVLSKSNLRGPDSTDSGSHDPTIQTNTSLTHKNSVESFNGGSQMGGRRYKPPTSIRDHGIQEEDKIENHKNLHGPELQPSSALSSPSLLNNPTYLSVHVANSTPTRLSKFLQFFHCIAKRTLDDSKRLSSYYSTPIKEPNILELEKTDTFSDKGKFQRCENFHKPCISNSSLKDIETGAIEDELTAYMKEIRRRELCS